METSETFDTSHCLDSLHNTSTIKFLNSKLVMARLCAGLVLLLSTSTTATPPTPRSPLAEATDATRCGDKEAVNETLSELMEDYFKWKLHTYPEWATVKVGS